MSATRLYLEHAIEASGWWRALAALDELLQQPEAAVASLVDEHAGVLRALVAAGERDLHDAVTAALAAAPPAFPALVARRGRTAGGALALLAADLGALARLSQRDLAAELAERGAAVPPARDLAPPEPAGPRRAALESLGRVLATADSDARLEAYLDHIASLGAGVGALHAALTWAGGELKPVGSPADTRLSDLHGLEPQLAKLTANTEALLAGAPAHDALLYGPRGSGKSTAVRGLVERYQDRGLRLVELPVEDLADLGTLLEAVADAPQSFVVFVDDLAFEDADRRYGPLKRVLDGGLARRPANAVVYATSNRRHLVKERLRDRPDPVDDDVHAWDTHNERLALADRFGLVLTFPGAGQKRYLELVHALAERLGVATDAQLDADAVRFAEWGNGYSGRTARQFVDTLALRRASPTAANR